MDIEGNRVLISYSTKDKASADAMRTLLKERGIATWMAPYDIPPGDNYPTAINRAIKDCACVVLIFSKNAQKSSLPSE